MAGKDGDMTFDELSSIYRSEISSTSLSTIRKDFYTAVQALIEEKSKECDKLAAENPDSFVYEGALQRKKNILVNLRKIVEKRMDKIAGMAMRGAMGAKNVIDNLTPEEKDYYNSILESSKEFWKLSEAKRKIMVSPDITKIAEPVKEPEPVVEKTEPVVKKTPVDDDIPLSEMMINDTPDEPEPIDDGSMDDEFEDQSVPIVGPEPDDVPVQEPEEAAPETVEEVTDGPAEEPVPVSVPNPLESIPDDANIIIRILEDLPPFSGPEWDYVLKKEDIVTMPAVLAKALINRGMARLVTA